MAEFWALDNNDIESDDELTFACTTEDDDYYDELMAKPLVSGLANFCKSKQKPLPKDDIGKLLLATGLEPEITDFQTFKYKPERKDTSKIAVAGVPNLYVDDNFFKLTHDDDTYRPENEEYKVKTNDDTYRPEHEESKVKTNAKTDLTDFHTLKSKPERKVISKIAVSDVPNLYVDDDFFKLTQDDDSYIPEKEESKVETNVEDKKELSEIPVKDGTKPASLNNYNMAELSNSIYSQYDIDDAMKDDELVEQLKLFSITSVPVDVVNNPSGSNSNNNNIKKKNAKLNGKNDKPNISKKKKKIKFTKKINLDCIQLNKPEACPFKPPCYYMTHNNF